MNARRRLSTSSCTPWTWWYSTMPLMRHIQFVRKRPEGSEPWVQAGFPSSLEWEIWSPHICGICCVKMLADTFKSDSPSIYSLTSRCYELGGFRMDDQQI